MGGKTREEKRNHRMWQNCAARPGQIQGAQGSEAKGKVRQDLIEHGEMGKLLALEGGKLEDGESEERSDEFF